MLPSKTVTRFLLSWLVLYLFASSAEAACDPSEIVVARVFDFQNEVRILEVGAAPQNVQSPN